MRSVIYKVIVTAVDFLLCSGVKMADKYQQSCNYDQPSGWRQPARFQELYSKEFLRTINNKAYFIRVVEINGTPSLCIGKFYQHKLGMFLPEKGRQVFMHPAGAESLLRSLPDVIHFLDHQYKGANSNREKNFRVSFAGNEFKQPDGNNNGRGARCPAGDNWNAACYPASNTFHSAEDSEANYRSQQDERGESTVRKRCRTEEAPASKAEEADGKGGARKKGRAGRPRKRPAAGSDPAGNAAAAGSTITCGNASG